MSASHPQLRSEPQALAAALSYFEVIHIYGSLGSLEESDPNSYLPYGLPLDGIALDRTTIMKSVERIKLYHESQATSGTSELLESLFLGAEVVCFLGFGFHPMNVKFLKSYDLGSNAKTKYFGSAYGLKSGEVAGIKSMLGFDIELGIENGDALWCLRSSQFWGGDF